MKNYIKSARDTLVALDFRIDQKDRVLRGDRWIFTHPNSPGDRLTLNLHMSELAARTVVQRAKQIVGMSTTETGTAPLSARSNGRAKAERAAETRRRETAQALADARFAERQAQRDAQVVAQRRRQLDALMRGRDDHGPAFVPDDFLTIEQAADTTGRTDKEVLRAIDSGALEAYMCGGVVKVKGADLRVWLGAA